MFVFIIVVNLTISPVRSRHWRGGGGVFYVYLRPLSNHSISITFEVRLALQADLKMVLADYKLVCTCSIIIECQITD